MKIENNNLIIEGMELTALEDMLKDVPYYLGLANVQLSAITEGQRREMLKKIKVISEMLKGNEQKCDKCRKPSKIFQGDFGELLCPPCYKEVSEEEENNSK